MEICNRNKFLRGYKNKFWKNPQICNLAAPLTFFVWVWCKVIDSFQEDARLLHPFWLTCTSSLILPSWKSLIWLQRPSTSSRKNNSKLLKPIKSWTLILRKSINLAFTKYYLIFFQVDDVLWVLVSILRYFVQRRLNSSTKRRHFESSFIELTDPWNVLTRV